MADFNNLTFPPVPDGAEGLTPGDRVAHGCLGAGFGVGYVVEVKGSGVVVAFDHAGQRTVDGQHLFRDVRSKIGSITRAERWAVNGEVLLFLLVESDDGAVAGDDIVLASGSLERLQVGERKLAEIASALGKTLPFENWQDLLGGRCVVEVCGGAILSYRPGPFVNYLNRSEPAGHA